MSKGPNRGHLSLRWVYCPEAHASGQAVELDAAHAKHLTGVLRLEQGAAIAVANGAGAAFHALLRVRGKAVSVELGEAVPVPPRMQPGFRVALGLPKNTAADFAVEKLAELGATAFEPFVTSRSVVRPGRGDEEKYVNRWRGIAAEALEQSQQAWVLNVTAPRSFTEIISTIKTSKAACFLFASESRNGSTLGQGASLMAEAVAQGKELFLVLGPEGGFSTEERKDLVAAGCRELSMGPAVLRVETAVVVAATLACLAMEQAELQT